MRLSGRLASFRQSQNYLITSFVVHKLLSFALIVRLLAYDPNQFRSNQLYFVAAMFRGILIGVIAALELTGAHSRDEMKPVVSQRLASEHCC